MPDLLFQSHTIPRKRLPFAIFLSLEIAWKWTLSPGKKNEPKPSRENRLQEPSVAKGVLKRGKPRAAQQYLVE